MLDDAEVSSGRTLRPARSALPVALSVNTEPEPDRELLLRHAEIRPDSLHVDPLWDMDTVSTRVRLSLGMGDRLLEPASYTVGDFAHGLHLLNVLTSSAISVRKSFLYCWPKSDRLFFANAVNANSGMSEP